MKRLTKSQYEAIASMIWASRYMNNDLDSFAKKLAYELSKTDTEFKQKEFLTLCGITD